jgi:hypothetical protein
MVTTDTSILSESMVKGMGWLTKAREQLTSDHTRIPRLSKQQRKQARHTINHNTELEQSLSVEKAALSKDERQASFKTWKNHVMFDEKTGKAKPALMFVACLEDPEDEAVFMEQLMSSEATWVSARIGMESKGGAGGQQDKTRRVYDVGADAFRAARDVRAETRGSREQVYQAGWISDAYQRALKSEPCAAVQCFGKVVYALSQHGCVEDNGENIWYTSTLNANRKASDAQAADVFSFVTDMKVLITRDHFQEANEAKKLAATSAEEEPLEGGGASV